MPNENHTGTTTLSYPNLDMPTWLPDDELVTDNGLSDEMRSWLDTSLPWGEFTAPQDCIWEARKAGRKAFTSRYGLKWCGYSDYCQHAITREKTCTPTQRKSSDDCEDIGNRYSIDHRDMFVVNSVDRRKKRIDMVVGQPYRWKYGEYVDELAAQARADGLDLLVSARQSYHFPGHTALIAIARPGILT